MRVTRSDGRVVRFAVTSVQEVPKSRFPTEAVYAPTPRPELRLITCGGAFDRAVRSYRDNVVVDAVLEDPGTEDPATDDTVTERENSTSVQGN